MSREKSYSSIFEIFSVLFLKSILHEVNIMCLQNIAHICNRYEQIAANIMAIEQHNGRHAS